ncbi:MAG: hypothetical protein GXP62_06055 [Oligoflexia bacterium]|nr:hypothetical protein [Oligoflexia bacterium]
MSTNSAEDQTLSLTQQDFFWVPDDVEIVDRPELLAISCPRDLVGLNYVTRTRGDARTLPRLVDEVRKLHSGRRSRWVVCPLEPVAALERTLAAAGYTINCEHHGYSILASRCAAHGGQGVVARPVVDRRGLLDWMDVSQQAFGTVRASTQAELDQYLAACTGPKARVFRVVSYDAGTDEPLSAGGLTLFPKLSMGFLWAGGTIPEGRGRGAYGAVIAARAAHAVAHGCDRIGLYARDDSSAPIVAGLGFQRHGRMAFWDRLP